jgi:hypothetical protein
MKGIFRIKRRGVNKFLWDVQDGIMVRLQIKEDGLVYFIY